MPIYLVPPTEPSPKQAVIERIKALPNARLLIQCNRCGSRSVLTITNGASIVAGRYKRGTVIEDRICADCHRQGIRSFMLPDQPKIAREPKPRRSKPKAVKIE